MLSNDTVSGLMILGVPKNYSHEDECRNIFHTTTCEMSGQI